METKTQDPKYIIIDGALANASTREFIPKDEPVFILRGKDIHAMHTILHYSGLCGDNDHRHAVMKRAIEFNTFVTEHRDRMSEPDTDVGEKWPENHD